MRAACLFVEKAAWQGADARWSKTKAGFILPLWESCLTSLHPWFSICKTKITNLPPIAILRIKWDNECNVPSKVPSTQQGTLRPDTVIESVGQGQV